MDYPIIIHGSENSLDLDAYVIIPSPLSLQDSKRLCESFKGINANLLCVEDGIVVWNYKGTIDECNNSILATYHLHEQTFPIPVEHKVQRSYALKLIRTIRGILSYVSRTELREEVKKALSSYDLAFKISIMQQIDFGKITDFGKSSVIETYKFMAFQLGQTLALLEDNKELFTKNAVAEYYPDLAVYLRREESDCSSLQSFYTRFVEFISSRYKAVDKHNLFCTDYHGFREVFDCKKEVVLPRVVVFDIDNTLMDETHRKHHRENGDWESYFDACHLDTPIQSIVDLTHQYHEKGYEVWLMSGRSESCMEKTVVSLRTHNVYFDHIKLRGLDNKIPDYILKPAWVGKYIGLERVDFVYDDLDRVIEGFKKKGLNVIDVKTLY